MNKVTVIIPTYKPGNYLWKCLKSMKAQTFPKGDFEVLVVLNGCKEPWKTVVETDIRNIEMENIRFIHTNEKGVSNARNIALKEANGEYITFVDDDDFISPQYLEELYRIASPQVVSLCYPLSFKDGTEDYEPYSITQDYEKWSKKEVLPYYKARRFFNGPVYKLIHRDIIGERRFDTRFQNGEDSLFMFLISDRLKYISFTSPKAVYYRRFRNSSATSSERILFNRMKLMWKYSVIYFSNISSYNFYFYITRILASFKLILLKH